jgi:general secretion pathway protein L
MMMTLAQIQERFSHWIDSVAATVVTLLDRVAVPRTVKLVEDEGGAFILKVDEKLSGSSSTPERIRIVDGQIDHSLSEMPATSLSGCRVELILQPDRFLFRPLELPKRASEFLNGIVRAQIDRLTPWNADEAAFGWSKPIESGADRMIITVAATTLASLKPYADAIAGAGPHSTAVFTTLPEADTEISPIKIWEERARDRPDADRVRRALIIIFAAASVTTGGALAATATIRASLVAQQDELTSQIANTRTGASTARNAARRSIPAAQRMLARRKNDMPLSVIVLESLSQVLPDHTYVTELRIEGNKLRVTGITRDAPSLIGLIEKSGGFTRATFFAPTTRSQSHPGERFHIEAVIQLLGSSSS